MLEATASDFAAMDASALTACIRSAGGRTVAVEVDCTQASPIAGVTHGELAAAMGADIIVLDGYDPFAPAIPDVPAALLEGPSPLAAYGALLGRPVGINLIAADAVAAAPLGGRVVSAESAARATEQGADLIFLYARPALGGSPALQQESARLLAATCGARVLLIGVPSFSQPAPRTDATVQDYLRQARALLDAGCVAIGLPMPGSLQGWRWEPVAQIVDGIHAAGGLAWLFVTGSVEGAEAATLRQLALAAKESGADAFRLDEAGLSGMPVPENILAFSLAIRGRRHTYRRMALSIRR